MFIIRIWNYLRGYAIIIVKGLKIERFINLAVVNNIYIWDIEKLDYTTVQAKMAWRISKAQGHCAENGQFGQHIEQTGLSFYNQEYQKEAAILFQPVPDMCFYLYNVFICLDD